MLEIISDAPFGVYILRFTWIGFNLLTETADMYIHSTYITRILISPYNVQQVLTTVNLIRIKYQKLQYIKFLCCQINSLYLQ